MSDFALPILTSLYTDVLTILKDRDVDLSTMFNNLGVAATNVPLNAIQFFRTPNTFRQWNGTVWQDLPISVNGGGTGGQNATDARTNLGLGTMATQNANNVAITGGTISGIASFAVSGAISAGSFTGDGAGLTNLNAAQLTAGIIPGARLPDPLPSLNGGNLYNLNASQLAFGTVPTARLGAGTADSSVFLRGDQQWTAPPSAGGFPSGMIVISGSSTCPVGWTRVGWDGCFLRVNAALDGSYMGLPTTHSHGVGSYAAAAHTHAAGTLNTPSHNHGGATGTVTIGFSISISGTTGSSGGHSHGVSATTGGESNGQMNCDAGSSGNMSRAGHTHSFTATTDSEANHTHSFSGSGSGSGSSTGSIPSQASQGINGATASGGGGAITGTSAAASHLPPFVDVVLCQKN